MSIWLGRTVWGSEPILPRIIIRAFFEWITHDKGTARKLIEFGEIKNPKGIRTISEMPNLTAAMQRAAWPEAKIRKVMGENWVKVLKEVWGE